MNRVYRKLTAGVAVLLAVALMICAMPMMAFAEAYDPENGYTEKLDGLRFWEDEKPGIRFYINAAERYLLESIPELGFGTGAGEWSAMDLLRGMYTGMDYINYIPDDYFDKYIQVFENEMIDKNGKLHSVKYTEYARLILAMSSLGYDIYNVAPHYREGAYDSAVVEEGTPEATAYAYDIPLYYSVKNSTLYRQGINGPIWALIALNTGDYSFYTREELQAGIDGENQEIADKLAAFGVTSLEAEGKTVNASTGKTTQYKGVATEGKQIEYILDKEIVQKDGTIGGWALSGTTPDPDMTGMALQALAPYYLDEERYNDVKTNAYYGDDLEMPYTYQELKAAVERAILALSKIQLDNGGYASWGSINAESITQVIVALTGLGIDPLSDNVNLPTINEKCSFIKDGEERDGVTTNNMIDALLSFWAWGSSPEENIEVGGFKHVTAGNDGGGGSGTTVNAMATDQALYGLIAYDRCLNGENSLYDMTDMVNGEYQDMTAETYTFTYDFQGKATNQAVSFSPYAVEEISSGANNADYVFQKWNTKADGTGVSYQAGENLSMPEKNITLYAVYSLSQDAQAAVNNVIDKINAIGTVTLDSETKITEARAAYNALTDTRKEMVSNYKTLTDAEAALSALKADKQAADAVIEKINAIGTVTLDSETKIAEARAAYNALTDVRKEMVSNYKTLTDAEAALSALKSDEEAVDAVVEKINAIGTVTLDSEAKITEARAAYNALTDARKEMVSNYETLTDAEAALSALKADKQAADAVIEKINAIGTVTLDSEAKIAEAREAYNALTDARKEMVTNYETLTDAETALSALKADKQAADAVIEKINAIGTVTLDSEAKIAEAREAYNALTDARKEMVTNYETLTDAETALSALKADKQAADAVIEKINAIGTVTLDSEAKIAEARAAYNALTDARKEMVTNYETLTDAETALSALKADKQAADAVIEKINAIGTVTLDKEAKIAEAREAYNALTDARKEMVTNYETLTDAETALSALKSDKEAVDTVVEKINAIGTVALDSETKIAEARAAYNALTDARKEMVTNYETLTDAETALSALKSDKEAVDAVVEKINAIGTVTLDKEAKIAEARAAYNALTDARKEMVTNYKTLTDTEAALTALKSQNDQSGNPDNPKTGDTTSIPLAILMLASSAGMCALLLKRRTTAE